MKPGDNNKLKLFYYRYLWWPWQIFLVSAAVFFMVFGIMVLIYAFRLNDPFLFIMTFFSSNLIILLSAVMVIAFVLRIIKVGWPEKKEDHEDNEEKQDY